jgi:hypothetical protein
MKPIGFKDKTVVITESLLQYCCNECNLVQYLA